MRQGLTELREFYASSVGRAARDMISRKVVETWGEAADLDILALGYATPYLDGAFGRARRAVAAMPASQGVEAWPRGERNRAFLGDELALPLANALFDRILAVHALEESEGPLALLREAARVLAPSGRLIVAVTARHGFWTDAENTPFGHGRPFSRRQLERLLREAELEPMGWTRALYVPPFGWAARWAEAFEQVGARVWPAFAGVIMMEAIKQRFAVQARRQPVRAKRRPVFGASPAPARRGLEDSLRRRAWSDPRFGPVSALEHDAIRRNRPIVESCSRFKSESLTSLFGWFPSERIRLLGPGGGDDR